MSSAIPAFREPADAERAGAEPTGAAAGWEAALDLAFVRAGAASDPATMMVRGGQRGPMAVQRPFFPEGPRVCHVYLLHPPGGLVGGDSLRVGIDVAPGAHALCTTPAAAKLYRSAGPIARQEIRIAVRGDGALEWLPQEAILYDGARADLRARIDLDAGARFVGLDMLCFGLPARRERYARGTCRQRLELWRDDRPIAIERGVFDGGAPIHGARWGLGGATVTGTLLASPVPAPEKADADLLPALRDLAAALPAGDLGSATVLGDGAALACRYLGQSAERGRRFLTDAWRLLRPALLGRPATPPRIWAT